MKPAKLVEDQILRLTKELLSTITCVNLDMSGNHKCALSHKSNKIITELNKLFNQT